MNPEDDIQDSEETIETDQYVEVPAAVNVFDRDKSDEVDDEVEEATTVVHIFPKLDGTLRLDQQNVEAYPLVGLLTGNKIDVGTFKVADDGACEVVVEDLEAAEFLQFSPRDPRFRVELTLDFKNPEDSEAMIVDTQVIVDDIPTPKTAGADRHGREPVVSEDEAPDNSEYEPWAGSPDQLRAVAEQLKERSRQLLRAFLFLEQQLQEAVGQIVEVAAQLEVNATNLEAEKG